MLFRVARWHEDGGLIDVRTREGGVDHVVAYGADGVVTGEYDVEAD